MMLVWSSMSFVELPTTKYLEKLVQLCSSMDKNTKKETKRRMIKEVNIYNIGEASQNVLLPERKNNLT